MTELLIHDVEVGGRRVDVRVVDGRIETIDTGLAGAGLEVVDGRGGALIPGLADHHLHLAALAATATSISAVDLAVSVLADRIRKMPPGPIRVVGWHESEPLGELDVDAVEALAPGREVRVQHRSGAAWVLSGTLLARLESEGPLDHEGFERDSGGRLTGRLFGGDDWLRGRLSSRLPDFAPLAAELAGFGLVALTDATPELDRAAVTALTTAFPQQLQLLGDPASTGPGKLLLPEHDLPSLDVLTEWINALHAAGRAVAVHSVTRASLFLTLAAIADAGALVGDRIEHAAVVPPEALTLISSLGVTVVTQPAIATSRGDVHRREVGAEDQPYLWPLRSLCEASIPVGLSSDAPHGPVDPWEVMRAARDRLTPSGADANRGERISAALALRAMTSSLDNPGGPARRVEVGATADLVLCGPGMPDVLAELDRSVVRAVWRGGSLIAGLVD